MQYLTALIGRAHALEYILSGRGVDAPTAAAIGWVNAAFADGEALAAGVNALAQRIAAFPQQALVAIKQRVNVQKPPDAVLQADEGLLFRLAAGPVAQAADLRYLALSEDQTASEFEYDVLDRLEELATGP